MYFFIGLTVFGVFGSFTYYLPELFPTRLRGTGAGFCYNAGRIVAAIGPFVVGSVASRGADALASALRVLFWVGAVPLAGLLLLPFVVETRGRVLTD
jgi:MFS family permease